MFEVFVCRLEGPRGSFSCNKNTDYENRVRMLVAKSMAGVLLLSSSLEQDREVPQMGGLPRTAFFCKLNDKSGIFIARHPDAKAPHGSLP